MVLDERKINAEDMVLWGHCVLKEEMPAGACFFKLEHVPAPFFSLFWRHLRLD